MLGHHLTFLGFSFLLYKITSVIMGFLWRLNDTLLQKPQQRRWSFSFLPCSFFLSCSTTFLTSLNCDCHSCLTWKPCPQWFLAASSFFNSNYLCWVGIELNRSIWLSNICSNFLWWPCPPSWKTLCLRCCNAFFPASPSPSLTSSQFLGWSFSSISRPMLSNM